MLRCLALVLLGTIGMASAQAEPETYLEGLLPMEALEKLVESGNSDCPICVRQLQKEAFEILSFTLEPGRVIHTTRECLLIRSKSLASNELKLTCDFGDGPQLEKDAGRFPRVMFRFHTLQDHLVGIDIKDYTPERFAALYRNAPTNTVFYGSLEIIYFSYGDGPSFLYSTAEDRIQIHCRILDLRIQGTGTD